MPAFRYHKNCQSRQYVNDVFMVIPENSITGPDKPFVVKAKTPAVFDKRSRTMRSKQGSDLWSASYGFRITKLRK